MWVFTQTGFVSAVTAEGDPNLLMVRSRDRQSLVSFCESQSVWLDPETAIKETAFTDYRYRVLVPHERFQAWLVEQASVDNLDYRNFKSRVTQTRGEQWHRVLMRIWSAALELGDRRNRWDRDYRAMTCLGTTKRGEPCRNQTTRLFPYCSRHENQAGVA